MFSVISLNIQISHNVCFPSPIIDTYCICGPAGVKFNRRYSKNTLLTLVCTQTFTLKELLIRTALLRERSDESHLSTSAESSAAPGSGEVREGGGEGRERDLSVINLFYHNFLVRRLLSFHNGSCLVSCETCSWQLS